jgi:hypothetical protein
LWERLRSQTPLFVEAQRDELTQSDPLGMMRTFIGQAISGGQPAGSRAMVQLTPHGASQRERDRQTLL